MVCNFTWRGSIDRSGFFPRSAKTLHPQVVEPRTQCFPTCHLSIHCATADVSGLLQLRVCYCPIVCTNKAKYKLPTLPLLGIRYQDVEHILRAFKVAPPDVHLISKRRCFPFRHCLENQGRELTEGSSPVYANSHGDHQAGVFENRQCCPLPQVAVSSQQTDWSPAQPFSLPHHKVSADL